MSRRQYLQRRRDKTERWARIIDRYTALVEKMRADQILFANHLISSWGATAWNTGRTFGCKGNCHVPIVRRAIRKALEQRP